MKTKLLFSIIFMSSVCCAQDGHFVDEIKLYANYSFTENLMESSYSSGDSIYFQMRESEKRILNLSPAIVFGAQKYSSHEIEVSKLEYSKQQIVASYLQDGVTFENLTEIDNRTIASFELKLRYEYKIGIFTSKNWKIKPKLGFSASPLIKIAAITSNLATSYDQSIIQGGIGFSVIPRLEYQINQKWYIDLNFPINMQSIEFRSNTVDNPSIRSANRTTTTINTKTHLDLIARLGIVFKI